MRERLLACGGKCSCLGECCGGTLAGRTLVVSVFIDVFDSCSHLG